MLPVTERLQLSEFTTEDSQFILRLVNTPSWLKFIGDRGVKNLQDAENYILNKLQPSYKTAGYGFWKVTLIETGDDIGMCGFIKRDGLEYEDLGFAFLPEYENKGYGFESASATLHFAQTIFHLRRMLAITVDYNPSSIALLKKLGFVFQKNIHLQGDHEMLQLYQADLYTENENAPQ